MESASDQFNKLFSDLNQSHSRDFVREVTFQVTERCSLVCSYCYQIKKSPKRMDKETAKQCVDLLFDMYHQDNDNSFISKNTRMIILDFIGGEPYLEVELIDYICEYFFNKALKEIPIWAENFKISISSNGVHYFEPKVQKFIYKWFPKLSQSISIDGNKEMHDACRVFPDGTGSWEIANAAEEDWRIRHSNIELGTKITIARENLPYLSQTIKYFLDKNYHNINANTVFEVDWSLEDAKLYYQQLKEVANQMLQYSIQPNINLFVETFFHPRLTTDTQTWCGGLGDMLAFDTEGNIFPCVRYMESSLGGQQKPICLGNCKIGYCTTKESNKILEEMKSVTWQSQNPQECLDCPIAQGCAECAAESYQRFGEIGKRSIASCWMHKARALANTFYWNNLYQKEKNNYKRFPLYTPKADAIKIVGEAEYNYLLRISLNEGE